MDKLLYLFSEKGSFQRLKFKPGVMKATKNLVEVAQDFSKGTRKDSESSGYTKTQEVFKNPGYYSLHAGKLQEHCTVPEAFVGSKSP